MRIYSPVLTLFLKFREFKNKIAEEKHFSFLHNLFYLILLCDSAGFRMIFIFAKFKKSSLFFFYVVIFTMPLLLVEYFPCYCGIFYEERCKKSYLQRILSFYKNFKNLAFCLNKRKIIVNTDKYEKQNKSKF